MMSIDKVKIKLALSFAKQNKQPFHLSIDTELALDKGIVGLFGGSGQGKSTLLKCLAGIEQVGVQSIEFTNSPIDSVNAENSPAVYQNQHALLFPTMTVEQNLDFVIKHSNWADKLRFNKQQVIDWCGIAALLKQDVAGLSGGERQRVSLARSLLCGKPVLLLDEPFSALDWHAREQMLSLLRHINKEYGLLIIIVSHSLRELALCAEQVAEIKNGVLAEARLCQQFVESKNTEQLTFARLPVRLNSVDEKHQLSSWELKEAQGVNIVSRGITENNSAHGNLTQGNLTQDSVVLLEANRVILSRAYDQSSSMLNQLECEVVELSIQKSGVLVKLKVQQQLLFSEISSLSAERLKLNLSDKVFAQFKAI